MREWIKGVIIGALWGVLGIIIGLYLGLKYMDLGHPNTVEWAIYYLFGFPSAFIFYLGDTLPIYGYIRVILPVIFGSLIGGGIGKALEFTKGKKVVS